MFQLKEVKSIQSLFFKIPVPTLANPNRFNSRGLVRTRVAAFLERTYVGNPNDSVLTGKTFHDQPQLKRI